MKKNGEHLKYNFRDQIEIESQNDVSLVVDFST